MDELLDEDDLEDINEEFEADDSSDSEVGSTELGEDLQELMNEVSSLAMETTEPKKGQQWLVVSEGKSTSPSHDFTLSKSRFSILEGCAREPRYFSRPLCFRYQV